MTDRKYSAAVTRGAAESARFVATLLATMAANPGGSYLGSAATVAHMARGGLAIKAKGLAPLRIKVKGDRGTIDPRAAWIRTTTPAGDSIDKDRDLARVILAWHNASGKARKCADDTLRSACHRRNLDPARVKAAWHNDTDFREGLISLV